jgi:uncharacterized protein
MSASQLDWQKELEQGRKDKDRFFATEHISPIAHEERSTFRGLKYFAPDPKYSIRAKLHKYDHPETVIMDTSKGTQQKFLRIGYFDFETGGKNVRLQAYKSAERKGDDQIFVPFKDKTSGKETYEAGRYLDLNPSRNDEYYLDFNFAYNPYCAYSDDYICPFPPRENWLDVEIRAGEKKYH